MKKRIPLYYSLMASRIAIKYLNLLGYDPVICETEDEARQSIVVLCKEGKWHCYFFESDTTGEKELEVFFTKYEVIDLYRFVNICIHIVWL